MAKSTSFGSRKLPLGKQYRTGTMGRAHKDLERDIDAAFKEIESTVATGDANGFVSRVYSGKVTITNPDSSATIAVANAADASPTIVQNHGTTADVAAVRFTASVSGEELTITCRDNAGNAVAPGAAEGDTIELTWWLDGRP